jgi:hypothetical protein
VGALVTVLVHVRPSLLELSEAPSAQTRLCFYRPRCVRGLRYNASGLLREPGVVLVWPRVFLSLVRVLDGYRVELIEDSKKLTDQLTNVLFLDGYRVELIERG